MNVYNKPDQATWPELIKRPTFDNQDLKGRVAAVLAAIKSEKDAAIRRFTEKFDGVQLDAFGVTSEEITAAPDMVDPSLQEAIEQAAANIQAFHQKQVTEPEVIETQPGVKCWRKSVPIQRVGLYIPGGSAPLFSTILMLGIPAVIAGCKEIILCSPPDKNGNLHPAILFTAQLVGIEKIYKIGGVQAIGAMAYGTESVPKVSKIFGPGNQYVTCAKQLVQEDGLAIDMPAGPSEVCVLADETAVPAFVAADLLSQAEHGPDSQAILITTSESLMEGVQIEIASQLAKLPRKDIAAKALDHSKLILVSQLEEAVALANEYAAEHLILAVASPETVAENIINAGSVFLGHYSPESAGDYASGTNHTLPTNGYATAYSGISVDSFNRKITFQQLSRDGLNLLAKTVTTMAEAEGLQAHAEAVYLRVQS